MNKVLLMPAVALMLFGAACDDSNDPVTPDTRASVRFFNATTGATANGGFTTNQQFASGSAIGFAQSSAGCTKVDEGTASFGFGAANSGGTALNGSATASLNNQTLTSGGNYIVVAVGPAADPTLYMFDNSVANSVAGTNAAVRFVNLAPGTDATSNTYVVYKSATVGQGTQVGTNIAVGAPTAFDIVASGPNQYAVLKLPGHVTAAEGTTGVLNFTAGSVNTVAIVLSASGGYQLINIPRC
jgi:hypothetical protein